MARRSRNEEAAMDSYFYARVRGEIVGTYAQAESDLAEKLRRFTALFEAQDREKRAQLSAGTITKAEYDSWLRGAVFRGERWKAVRQECVDQIHRANETTARMLNGERRALFQKAANYSAYQIERGTQGAVSFTLYDSATVTRLIQKRPKLLPDLKVGKRRDESWNGRGIQNAITQGIIQGESIPDIAKRIAHQTGERNRAALTRQARTAMTGAQNAGRVQAMWEAEDEGIKIQKKWIATLDRKTRDAHAELDGQIVDADKPFVVNGMEIMYPGDPNADPSLVYNCRCTLGWEYPDYPSAPGARRDNETGEVIGGVTYQQWEANKEEDIHEATPLERINEQAAHFNNLIAEKEDLIKTLEKESEELFPQTILSYGSEGWEAINSRYEKVQNELTAAYTGIEDIRRERQRYFSQPGEQEIEAVFGRIKGEHTIESDAAATNRITGDSRSTNNCAYCVLAYDARRRGIDCKAPYIYGGNNNQIADWFGGLQLTSAGGYSSDAVIREISEQAKKWGEGARGIVQIDFTSMSGHYIALEVKDGRCLFIDPQTGSTNAEAVFQAAMTGGVRYGRTDDRELSLGAVFYLEGGGWSDN